MAVATNHSRSRYADSYVGICAFADNSVGATILADFVVCNIACADANVCAFDSADILVGMRRATAPSRAHAGITTGEGA